VNKSENLLVKFLIALAGVTIGVVVVLTIIAFQIGVDELEKPNRIAIISGLLSMVGGIAGAFGAYFVATYQMKKQFENQEKNRALELKINKSNIALNKLVGLKEFVHKIKGELTNMEVEVIKAVSRRERFLLLNKYDLIDKNYRDQLKLDIDVILGFRKEIEKLKIFIKNEVDIDTFNVEVFKYIDAYKKYINLNWEFEDSISVTEVDLYSKWLEINAEFNFNNENFIEILNENIIKIENYITEILEVK